MEITITSSQAEFMSALEQTTNLFKDNSLYKKILNKSFTIEDYHNYLVTIFPQVFESSSTFAISGAGLKHDRAEAREYLFKHAEEEKTHWRWIIDDINNLGFKKVDFSITSPKSQTIAYVAFNYYIATNYPIARLGIAAMLESLGAHYGKNTAINLKESLSLSNDQLTFLFGHGDTDIGHTKEIIEVLERSNLNGKDWGILTYSTKVSFDLYNNMIESVC